MTVREVAVEAYRETLPVLLPSAVGGLFAGAVLGGMEAELEQVAGLIVLVPALLATRGTSTARSARDSGRRFTRGLVSPSSRWATTGSTAPSRRRWPTACSSAPSPRCSRSRCWSHSVATSRGLATLVAIAVLAGAYFGRPPGDRRHLRRLPGLPARAQPGHAGRPSRHDDWRRRRRRDDAVRGQSRPRGGGG